MMSAAPVAAPVVGVRLFATVAALPQQQQQPGIDTLAQHGELVLAIAARRRLLHGVRSAVGGMPAKLATAAAAVPRRRRRYHPRGGAVGCPAAPHPLQHDLCCLLGHCRPLSRPLGAGLAAARLAAHTYDTTPGKLRPGTYELSQSLLHIHLLMLTCYGWTLPTIPA